MVGAGREDEARSRFAHAYQAAIEQWPVPVSSLHVPTEYGTTHVLACGPGQAPPLLLLPGGGATATAWSAVAGELSGRYRVFAVDPIGQPGRSTPGARPIRTAAAVTDWIGQLLAGPNGLTRQKVVLAGHSYGAWMALRFTLDAPGQVRRLVLVDPTDCFAGLRLSYRLRAAPVLIRPCAGRMSRFLGWETGGRPLDPAWLAVITAGQDLGRPALAFPRPFTARELARLGVPALVVIAGASHAHDASEIAQRARHLLPDVTTATIATATHHTLPTQDPHELAACIEEFIRAG